MIISDIFNFYVTKKKILNFYQKNKIRYSS